jgi:hypothetical protein
VTGQELLNRYIETHNAAVRSGDWSEFGEWFADDAEMRFEGAPVGPFRGREEIRSAYQQRPPDDEVELLATKNAGGLVVADYGWSKEPGARAGELRLRTRGDRISELVVTFG